MRRSLLAMRIATPATRLTVVAILVVVLVIAQFALLIGGGIAAGRSATRALDDTFEYLADISEERVVSFVRSAEEAVYESVGAFKGDEPPALSVVRDFFEQLSSRPEVASVSVTYTNGEYVELARSTTNTRGFSAHVITLHESGTVAHRFTEYDSQLRLISEHHNVVTLDPRETPTYVVALGTAQLTWTDPAVDLMTGKPQIAVVQSARTTDGAVRAVVTATVYLDSLARRLNSLPAGSDGEVFLIAADRTVITASRTTQVTLANFIAVHDRMPTLEDLGVGTSKPGTPRDPDAVGSDGASLTLERGLKGDGVPWIIHMRASAVGLNSGFAGLKATLGWVIGGLVVLTAALAYLLAIMWGPLVRMREGAVRDPLTGLYNRRHADLAAEKMLAMAHRLGRRLVMVMLDLDNFKRLNDDLGHRAGDQALAEISTALRSEIRASDMAVRWGGDEFLVALVLPQSDHVPTVVERIRGRVEAALVESFGTRRELGITAGYAVSHAADDDVQQLIADADLALVEGKAVAKGRTYGSEDAHVGTDA